MHKFLLAVWVAVGVGCGGGDDDDSVDACGPEEALPGTSIDDIGKYAQVSVQERQPEGGPIQRSANAIFMDFSTYDGDAPPVVGFDDPPFACSTVAGNEVVNSEPTILDSPSSAMLVVGGEEFALEEIEQGRMQTGELTDLSDGDDVSVTVVGGDGDTQFPSFDAALEAPGAPNDIRGEMSPEDGALVVHWTPANAEAVEIEFWVQNPDPERFHPVRCVVRDDGCLTLPSLAVSSYLSMPVDVRMSAVRSAQWDGPDGEIGFLKVERRRDITYAP